MTTGTILLVRHGETDWNRTERIQGWAPVSLNDRGREQARVAGAYLKAEYDPDRLVASDLRRTRETARLVRRGAGIDHDAVSFESGWRERSFGVYQGLSYEEVYGTHPEFAVWESGTAALEATPESGESIVTARRRVLSAFEELVEGLDGETVVVVTHGGPVHVVRSQVLGRDLLSELAEHHTINGSLQVLDVAAGEATLVESDLVPPGAPDADPTVHRND